MAPVSVASADMMLKIVVPACGNLLSGTGKVGFMGQK
jgi:hypothetical protein